MWPIHNSEIVEQKSENVQFPICLMHASDFRDVFYWNSMVIVAKMNIISAASPPLSSQWNRNT